MKRGILGCSGSLQMIKSAKCLRFAAMGPFVNPSFWSTCGKPFQLIESTRSQVCQHQRFLNNSSKWTYSTFVCLCVNAATCGNFVALPSVGTSTPASWFWKQQDLILGSYESHHVAGWKRIKTSASHMDNMFLVSEPTGSLFSLNRKRKTFS